VRYPAPAHDAKAAVRWLRAKATQVRAGSGPHRDRWRLRRRPLASLTALTAGDAQLEAIIGDHLGVSSAVSAVVRLLPQQRLSLPFRGRNPLETQILPPPWSAALLGLDRIDDAPSLRDRQPRVTASTPARRRT
jgi:hypothetical protein